jgi:hypothetical protein
VEEYVSPAMIQVAGNGELSDQSLGVAVLIVGVLVFVVALIDAETSV